MIENEQKDDEETLMTAPQDILREKIYPITEQLENTLKALVQNPNGSEVGKAQAQHCLNVVEPFNQMTAPAIIAAAAATATQSRGFGRSSSLSSSSSSDLRGL